MVVSPQNFVPTLIAVQFVAFGWRLNREITQGDNRRITWLPLPDYLNLLSLLAVILCCVVAPTVLGDFGRTAKTTLTAAYVLIAFHPVNEAAHYRLLFSREGRAVYRKVGKDIPWITDQEIFTVIVSIIAASVAGCVAWHASVS
jgi:hypothetical protein